MTEADVVDPARVPVYPVVRLELRPVGGDLVHGVFEAVVDGRVVATGERSAAHESATAAAAVVARSRPIRAVRVRLLGFEEAAGEGVVDAAGRLHMAGPASAPTRRRGVGRLVKGLIIALLVVVPVGGLVWVAVTSGAFAALSGGREAAPTIPRPTPTQLPVSSPPGWSSVAAWSRTLGAGSSPAVAAAGGRVFLPSSDGSRVLALAAVDGHEVWSARMPGAVLGAGSIGGPLVTQMDGRPVVVAWTNDQLAAWVPESGRQLGEWPLPEDGATVVDAGSAVLVVGQSRHVGVLTAGSLRWRVLAAGAVPVGASESGELVAAADGRAWVTTSDQLAGDGVALEGPAGTAWAGVVGLGRGSLVVAYSSGADGVVLRAFATSTWSPLWTSRRVATAAAGGVGGSALRVAPGGGWGLYGSTWVDLVTGEARPLPADWSTSTVGSEAAFGVVAGGVGVVDDAGTFTAPADQAAAAATGSPSAPSAVTEDGLALIVASDGSRSSLYAVPRGGTP